ncbi:MAG: polysaccharide deacetylase family protein [Acidimicrobiales bacterium]
MPGTRLSSRSAPVGAFGAGTAMGLAIAGAAAYGAYALPALAWVAPLRNRLAPALAGIGNDPGHVALTFDDGPDPGSTPFVLEALRTLGWKATFFCLGSMAAAAPALTPEVVSAGHEIGVHGYEHRGALRRSPSAITADLLWARDVIANATGAVTHWYRPPFGEMSAGVFVAARAASLRPVMWSAWGRDWRAEATPATVIDDLSRGVLRGGTILLHDSDCTSAPGSWRTTVAALPLLADHLAALGVRPGPLGDHGLIHGGAQAA